MGEYFTWTKLFAAGGITLIILIICSIVSFIIIIERVIYFHSHGKSSLEIITNISDKIETDDIKTISGYLGNQKTPVGYVLLECMKLAETDNTNDSLYEEVKSRAIAEKLPEMEKYLNIEATLGTVSPFIGLLGTVMGIIRSFQSLGSEAAQGTTNMIGLNAGIAEALVATAAGLFVAIPATIAYNYFRKEVNNLVLQSEIAASRLKIILRSSANT